MPRPIPTNRKPGTSRRKTRRDAGRKKLTPRDWRGIRFVAEQTFVSVEQLGQWLAPDLEPASDPPQEDQANDTPTEKLGHGGSRKLPWPVDRKKRLHAAMQLVTRWEQDHGLVEVLQPLAGWPYWVRATPLALRQLGLAWSDTPFPEEKERLAPDCHFEHITQTRLLLARGKLQTPKHEWISERQIWAETLIPERGEKRPHRPDGYLVLQENGAYDMVHGGQIVATIVMQAGQRVAIEVERTRKNDLRLEYILPDLLQHHDFAWYFCLTDKVYNAVVAARRDVLRSDGERSRIRILRLEEE